MAHEPRIFFDEVNQRQGAFHRRIFLLGGATGVGLLALGGRLAQLQLIDNGRYKLMSADNQFNFRLTPPPRGRIMDRNGVLLAGNRPNFRVLMTKNEVQDPEGTVQKISEIVPMTDERRAQIFRDLKQNSKFTPVALAEDLTWDEFSAINIRAPELPGVTADMGEVRLYRYGGAFAHVIGYVAKVSAEDVEKEKAARNGAPIDPIILNPGFRIGRQGIEKSFDGDLRGKAGAQKVEVDARGRVVRKDPEGDIPPTPGKDIVLTLDSDVQNRALDVFGEDSGAAVVMDVRSGDILCLLSAPSFDANQFVTGVPSSLYKGLSTYDRKPLLDKALFGLYPPGSTFKTMVALAALEHGYDRRTVHVCNRAWSFGGRVWHCDKAHGAQDLAGAIKTSCDIYFYQCALTLGPDRIADMAQRFGLGQKYDLGGLDMKRGIVPSTEWKKKYFKKSPPNQKWYPGETPSYGIGQGYLQVNAMQLCVMASRLANGQKALMPKLVHSVGGVVQPRGSDVPDLPVDKEHLAFVRQAMAAVVASGTAAANGAGKLDLGPIQMAGKTGTAQSHSYGGGNGAHGAVGAWNLRDHAWFIAFAPHDEPRYAMALLVEHGGFGATAAVPKAREIMRVALLKDPEIRQRILQAGAGLPQDQTVAATPGSVKTARLDRPSSGSAAGMSSTALTQPGERSRWVVKLAEIDWTLAGLLSAIACIGGLMLYSIAGSSWTPWAADHLVRFCLFFAFMILLALMDLRVWFAIAYPTYILAVVMLVGVDLFGHASLGAQRWLAIGPLKFQPSELMKIGLVLALARLYHGMSARDATLSWKLLIPAFMTLLPAALIAKQPDLGTAILVTLTGAAVMVLAGLSMRIILAGAAAVAAIVPPAFMFVLHDYQRQRLLTFLHPETDPSGAGYHTLQAKIALGSGGLLGKGYGLGSQSQLNFLPEKQTDFIFATLAEEFGFAGCAFVLLLFGAAVIIALRIAAVSHSHFGRLAASGVTATFALYVLINGAMVMGLAPVVGVPMPLLSYGGTVMLTVMVGFGLVQCVKVHRYAEVTSGKGALL